jgi:prepilin-type N-terminal cleavage/methylation domain-containing protein
VRHRRKGFTLLELLAVIGIILVLISIAILAYKHVDQAVTAKATKATLSNCQAMLAEYEINNPLNTDLKFSIPVPTPTDVNPGGIDRLNGQHQYDRTQYVMALLNSIPKNNQMIAQLPARSLLTGAANPTLDPNLNAPILLDGWKNPIIYVSAAGLVVNLPDSTTKMPAKYTVRTSGIYPNKNPLPPITALDRPFFASAGPDGNFQNGDDNIYSFQP